MRHIIVLTLAIILAATPAAAHHRLFDEAGVEAPATIGRADGFDVDGTAEEWNRLAGRTLLVPTNDPDPTITVAYGTPEGASPRDAWKYCDIQLERPSWLTHEVGHCLGLADHVEAKKYDRLEWANPRVCDDENHSAYHPYKGVMSYCWARVSDEDRDAIRAVYPSGDDDPPGAVLVNAQAWPDALTAATLGVDLLYVDRDTVPDVTWQALQGVTHVWIVGGTSIVSQHVEAKLYERGFRVTRLAGPDRYHTAAEVAGAR